jgi:hypothetical protein
LCISVITNQTSPIASADIQVLVFVSGSDNLEFANPADISQNLSPYAIQSGEKIAYTDVNVDTVELGNHRSIADDNINLVYMGETVTSLRQLFRRSAIHAYMPNTHSYVASETSAILQHRIARRPRYPGYDTNGPDDATGLTSALSEPYNWVNWHFMSFFELCFVGVRGSVNWIANYHGNVPCNNVFLSRELDLPLITGAYTYSSSATSRNEQRRMLTTYGRNSGLPGVTATNQRTQTVVHASTPMYSNYKFQNTGYLYRTLGKADDATDYDAITIGAVIHPENDGDIGDTGFDLYVSAGTDYNLIFFLNVPALYYYASIPVPT